MRFMVIVKATADSESGKLPDPKLMAAEGLQPSAKGARIRYEGSKRTVIDGPFAETKELIAGFWLIQVKSKDEAIEWMKRCPNPFECDSEIEIRQVYEMEDFAEIAPPQVVAQEERLRSQLASA